MRYGRDVIEWGTRDWYLMLYRTPLRNRRPETHTLYELDTGSGGLTDGKIEELHVNRGQAMVFSSSFCHSGGLHYTIEQTGYVLYI